MIIKLPYEDGTWFAVPLRKGGYGTGVVARHSPDGIMLVYLFGSMRDDVANLADTAKLINEDGIKIVMASGLGLIKGRWPIIGKSASWKRDEWPMPQFVRKDDLSRTAWLVTYADDNPNQVVAEERVPFDITGFEKDSLLGAGAVEILLTRLLS